jgi:MFS family permease
LPAIKTTELNQPDDDKLRANIRLCLLMNFLSSLYVYIPTWVAFLSSRGLTLQDVFLLKSCMTIATVLMEVPSGYFADYYGRKFSLVAGGLLNLLGVTAYWYGGSFSEFLVGELLLGAGFSLLSGADRAIFYESLLLSGQEDKALKAQSKLGAMAGYAEALGGLVSTACVLLADLSSVYLVQIFLYAAYSIASFKLKEPSRRTAAQVEVKQPFYKLVVNESFNRSPVVSAYLLFGASLGTASFLIVWVGQAQLKTLGMPDQYMGVLWAVLHLVMGVMSATAHRLEAAYGERRSLLLMAFVSPIAYLGLSLSPNPWLAVSCILLIYAERGARTPLFANSINRRVGTEFRATVLSMASFLRCACFTVVGYLFGLASNWTNVGIALFLIAAATALGNFLSFRNLSKELKNEAVAATTDC